MILFNSVMQKEKIAAVGLVIIIVVALSAFIIIEYGDEIFTNISEEKLSIEYGDCADVTYIGRFASNNSIFESTYEYVDNKSGNKPINVFVTLDITEFPPEGYEEYSPGFLVDGFIEGLVGLKEGQSYTIGPISPEKAYGVAPKTGDVIHVSDESLTQDMNLVFIKIKENAPVPPEFQDLIPGNTTTLYVLKDNSYFIGLELTLYQSWPNATVVTKINETMMWIQTTPPDDKMTNFTWNELDLYGYEISYWENASSVTTLNETTIIVTHSPTVGQNMEIISGTSQVEYTVVSLTSDKINVSFEEYDGNLSYIELDRKVTIVRNESQNITYSWPYEMMEYVLSFLRDIDPTITYSLHPLAGESVIYEVEIDKVYKTSQKDS